MNCSSSLALRSVCGLKIKRLSFWQKAGQTCLPTCVSPTIGAGSLPFLRSCHPGETRCDMGETGQCKARAGPLAWSSRQHGRWRSPAVRQPHACWGYHDHAHFRPHHRRRHCRCEHRSPCHPSCCHWCCHCCCCRCCRNPHRPRGCRGQRRGLRRTYGNSTAPLACQVKQVGSALGSLICLQPRRACRAWHSETATGALDEGQHGETRRPAGALGHSGAQLPVLLNQQAARSAMHFLRGKHKSVTPLPFPETHL